MSMGLYGVCVSDLLKMVVGEGKRQTAADYDGFGVQTGARAARAVLVMRGYGNFGEVGRIHGRIRSKGEKGH